MLFVIDAGNTNIVFAVYDGGVKQAAWRCRTDGAQTADEYAAFLRQMFALSDLAFSDISEAIVSSVVPAADFQLRQLCQTHFSCRPKVVDYALVKDRVRVLLEKPQEVGADRLVNAIAVKAFYRAPAIVVDFGTATTFDVVDAAGAYVGGAIAPGINLSMDALHRAAAKLPRIDIQKPGSVIGTNTVDAMRSGVYWGYVCLVEGMVRHIAKEMEEKPFVLATGGLAALIAGGTDVIDQIDDELTLKGLVHIHSINKEKRS